VRYSITKLGYLIRAGIEIFRSEGTTTFFKKGLKYISVQYTPARIWKLWKCKLSGTTRVTKEVMGSIMELDLTDGGINTELFLDGIREVESTRELQARLKPNWIVVDVGANIGYYALQEARTCAKVYAIEPEPANYRRLVRNIELNNYQNIAAMNLAVGDKIGKIYLKSGLISNATRVCRDDEQPDAEVEVETLDSLFPDTRVDFVRMDVEGYEFNVLQGMRNILSKYKPCLFIEVHGRSLKEYGYSQEQLLEFLADYGYSITFLDIYGRYNTTGLIKTLLEGKKTKEVITQRGIAPRFFFDYIKEAK